MPYTVTPSSPGRIHLVDSLRGLALMAIVILHSMEHYNLFGPVQWQPQWLNNLDSLLSETVWFLLAGKAYATFSLLFGFSFFIQLRNARSRGHDFRLRFLWRLFLLALFAQFHALFYNGDILLFYAFCGIILIPASSWSNRTVIIVAFVLLLQPIDWLHIIFSSVLPDYTDLNSRFMQFAVQAEQTGMHGSFLEVLRDNIGNGQLYSNFWQVEAGRICQTPGLFLIGMWLARKEMFVSSENSRRFWRKVAVTATLCAMVIYCLKSILVPLDINPTWTAHIGIALGLPFNFTVMAIFVSLLCLCWFRTGNGYAFQRMAVPYGKMSLTNYIFQSIIGVFIFYHFGLGLFRLCGATLSLLVGIVIIAAQLWFSRRWLENHRQGPLENLWKRLTWLGTTQKV